MVIPYKFAQMINTMKFRSMTPGLTSGAACSDFFGVMQAWLGPVPNNQEVLNRQPRSHTAEDLAKSAFVSKPEFIDFLETECRITLLSHVANPCCNRTSSGADPKARKTNNDVSGDDYFFAPDLPRSFE